MAGVRMGGMGRMGRMRVGSGWRCGVARSERLSTEAAMEVSARGDGAAADDGAQRRAAQSATPPSLAAEQTRPGRACCPS
jgi:hypothetical protein